VGVGRLLEWAVPGFRHGVEPAQIRISVLDREVGGAGRRGGHMVACEASAAVAMAVEYIPKVPEYLEGHRAATRTAPMPSVSCSCLLPSSGRLAAEWLRQRQCVHLEGRVS